MKHVLWEIVSKSKSKISLFMLESNSGVCLFPSESPAGDGSGHGGGCGGGGRHYVRESLMCLILRVC